MGLDRHRAGFDVLGVRFWIEADRSAALEPLEHLLAAFRRSATECEDEASPGQTLSLHVDAGGGQSALECDGDRYPIRGGIEGLLAHTYSLLLHWVFGQVGDHFLLHGAAVAREGRGLILSGHSGVGKTTLSCALAEEPGWEWFSDDVAPLRLADGLLCPFPKALSLRPGIARPELLAAGCELPVLEQGAKSILSPQALGLTVGTEAVVPETLVFLDPEPVEPHPDTAPLSVVVHQHVAGLLERVRALPDVISARERAGARFVQLEIDTAVPARCLGRIAETCRQAGALVIGTAREAQRAEPDFKGRPRLEPLDLDQAVRLFLRGLWGTAQYRLVTELGGGAALYARVAGLLAGVRCLRLVPGRFEESLTLLRELPAQR